jgi:3,4-dihydroxy 2-butanone 4-phosphate synthase
MSSDVQGPAVTTALEAFGRGEPVLVHDADSREDETDIIYPADAVDAEAVARMRNDAGGLICVALSASVADAFDLPFLAAELSHPASEDIELAYGDRSSFSLPVNHRETGTGITDTDRALTITELAAAADDPGSVAFADRFHSPGHVPVLRAAEGLFDSRQGHTELGVAMAIATGRAPAAVVCEMLDDTTGEALSTERARRYAQANDVHFLDGQTVIETLSADDTGEV